MIVVAVAIIFAIVIAALMSKVERTKGKNNFFHLAFVCLAVVFVLVSPEGFHRAVFSPVGIAIVAGIYPCYVSVVAVASPQEEDDKAILQYWLVASILQYFTAWMNILMGKHSSELTSNTANGEVNMIYNKWWSGFSFFFLLWLIIPWTDGSYLIHNKITAPFLTPIIEPFAKNFNVFFSALISTSVNGIYIWVFFVAFHWCPDPVKSILTISVGIVYPWICSVVAAHTDEVEDDTYWLTYWSCYGLLFLAMQFIEQYSGSILGFYYVILAATIYLMLPMFQGSEKVFRYVLVPLFGQHEMLILRDAKAIEKQLLRTISKKRVPSVRKAISDRFSRNYSELDPFLPKDESTSYNTSGIV